SQNPAYTPPMAEPPDLAELARRYVALWQEQLIAMAADPAFAQGMAGLFKGLSPQQGGFGHGFGVPEPGSAEPGPAPRAAPAGAAPGQRQPDLVHLASRLAALEKRLAALETGAGGKRKRAAA